MSNACTYRCSLHTPLSKSWHNPCNCLDNLFIIDILKTDKHMHNFMQIKRLKPFWFNEEVVLVQPINKTEDPFQLFLSLMIYVSSLKVSLFIPKIFKLKFCFECQWFLIWFVAYDGCRNNVQYWWINNSHFFSVD